MQTDTETPRQVNRGTTFEVGNIKPRLLSITGAVAYSGDSRAKLYAEAKSGCIQFVKMDGATRVFLSKLDRYIDAKARPAHEAVAA